MTGEWNSLNKITLLVIRDTRKRDGKTKKGTLSSCERTAAWKDGTKWRLCSGKFEIQTERSDLSLSGSSFGVLRGLIRRFCCRCGRCWLPERRKVEKVRDSQDPEIPIQLGFPKGRYPARNGEPHSSSDGHRRLRENPEDRCDTQENAATKFTQSRYFYEKGRAASKREFITYPKKV
jgi:hypothetical protein